MLDLLFLSFFFACSLSFSLSFSFFLSSLDDVVGYVRDDVAAAVRFVLDDVGEVMEVFSWLRPLPICCSCCRCGTW